MTRPEPLHEPSETGPFASSERLRDLTGKTLGDFQVERLLGHGGMGEVYLARQISLDRPVALKVLKPDLLSNPTYLARFESEAWAAARLNHPNIVHIYSLGTADDVRFIVMEYVQGTNLREYLVRRGVPALPLALSIMKQATLAVGAAAEAGLVHRDIKPDNLLLTRKGQVKVADFGLVSAPETEHLHLTRPGVTLGTPMYMSPEQVQGHPMDHRSDLYSLGVTFYHMLAGVPPFRAETGMALALKHVRETAVSLAVHRPDLPADLVRLVMKLMEKDPSNRPQSSAEVLRDLSKVREALSASAGTANLATSELTVITGSEPAVAPTRRDKAKRAARPASKPDRAASSIRWNLTLNPTWIVGLSLATLLVGALLGWRARAVDLLGSRAPTPHGPPALWLAPWRSIEGQSSPEAQYRYALFRAPIARRDAAWLAVPGRYPQAHEWASRAYIQLARDLLRFGDAERLDALAADLARSPREHDKLLAQVAEVSASALRDDPQEVVSRLSKVPLATIDPSLAEVCAEAVQHARTSRTLTASDRATLNRAWNLLSLNLGIEYLSALPMLNLE
ncbi:MAG: protein kinase [Isosphaeraceae bacterium]